MENQKTFTESIRENFPAVSLQSTFYVRFFGGFCGIVSFVTLLCWVVQCLAFGGGGPDMEKEVGPWLMGTFYTHVLTGIGFVLSVIAVNSERK